MHETDTRNAKSIRAPRRSGTDTQCQPALTSEHEIASAKLHFRTLAKAAGLRPHSGRLQRGSRPRIRESDQAWYEGRRRPEDPERPSEPVRAQTRYQSKPEEGNSLWTQSHRELKQTVPVRSRKDKLSQAEPAARGSDEEPHGAGGSACGRSSKSRAGRIAPVMLRLRVWRI